jgi:2-(3-amino-3-carboxypropyl)histidine synthase
LFNYNSRYDPYSKIFSREYYEFDQMKSNRKKQIDKSLILPIEKQNQSSSVTYGLILSTLGRQGSPKILDNLMNKLKELNKEFHLVLLSEIFPDKLKLFGDQIDTYYTFNF